MTKSFHLLLFVFSFPLSLAPFISTENSCIFDVDTVLCVWKHYLDAVSSTRDSMLLCLIHKIQNQIILTENMIVVDAMRIFCIYVA